MQDNPVNFVFKIHYVAFVGNAFFTIPVTFAYHFCLLVSQPHPSISRSGELLTCTRYYCILTSYPGHPMFFNDATLKNMGWPGYEATAYFTNLNTKCILVATTRYLGFMHALLLSSLVPRRFPLLCMHH